MSEKEKKSGMKSAAEFLLKADLVAGSAMLLWGTITANLALVGLAGAGFIGNIVGHKALKSQHAR